MLTRNLSAAITVGSAIALVSCGPGNLTPSTEQDRAAIEAAVRGCGLKVMDPTWFWIREFKQWEFKFDTNAAGMAKAECVEKVKERMITSRNLDVAVGYSEMETAQ